MTEDSNSGQTVHLASVLARYQRALGRLTVAEKRLAEHKAEYAAAYAAYDEAQASLASGGAQPGRSHARFDRQTLVWSVDANKMAETMRPQMLRMIQIVFGDAPLDEPLCVTFSGQAFRHLMETKLATTSTDPLRMYHCYRTELIQRGILRQI
jgi:hypothetical protein